MRIRCESSACVYICGTGGEFLDDHRSKRHEPCHTIRRSLCTASSQYQWQEIVENYHTAMLAHSTSNKDRHCTAAVNVQPKNKSENVVITIIIAIVQLAMAGGNRYRREDLSGISCHCACRLRHRPEGSKVAEAGYYPVRLKMWLRTRFAVSGYTAEILSHYTTRSMVYFVQLN